MPLKVPADILVEKVLRTSNYTQIRTQVKLSSFWNHLHSKIHQFFITLLFWGFIDNCTTTQFLNNQPQYFCIFFSAHKPSLVKHSWLINCCFTTHILAVFFFFFVELSFDTRWALRAFSRIQKIQLVSPLTKFFNPQKFVFHRMSLVDLTSS